MSNIKLSICIPAYNKHLELDELLYSILKQKNDNIEIIIREDYSPEREEIIDVVKKNIIKFGKCKIKLILNESNFGYDKNLRETINSASGDYVILCGNDDIFTPNSLNIILKKIIKYDPMVIVRSYESFYKVQNNSKQIHRYVRNDTLISKPTTKEIAWIFYRSVLVSGLVLKNDLAKKYSTPEIDGYLYYQNYLIVKLFLDGPILYIPDIIIQSRLVDYGSFGTAKSERNKNTRPNERTINSSINQMSNFFKCAQYSERSSGYKFLNELKLISSAYALPLLSYHIDKGNLEFVRYVKGLKNIGYKGFYFYLYVAVLLIFRKKGCITIMQFFKKILGSTIRIV